MLVPPILPFGRSRSKTGSLLALLLFCVPPSLAAPDVTSLRQAVDAALSGNPGLAEFKARAEALAAMPSQEGALPDPALNVDLLNVPTNSFSLRQEDMTMLEMGLTQTFPFPGKLALKEKAAEQEALAAMDEVEVARWRLNRDVRQAWWRLFYYDRAIAVTHESERFFQELVDAAQSRYRVGQGAQQEVLMAQLELSKLKDERLELVGMRHGLSAQFNVLIDRKPQAPVVLPEEAQVQLRELDEAKLEEQAQQANPLLARHRKSVEAARTRVDLAQKDYLPDLTLGAGYAVRQNAPNGTARSDFASIRLSVNLPIYAGQKQAKAVDQRRSELLQAQYSAEDDHHRIQAEITGKAAEYRHARERLALLEHELIPQAEQTVRSLMAGYRAGKAGFSDLLRAQLSHFQYQSQYWRALSLSQEILAELSAAVGQELAHD